MLASANPGYPGEPLLVAPDGSPYRWNVSAPLAYYYDTGQLGILSNTAARGLLSDAFGRWAGISTAAISFQETGAITNATGSPLDINLSNFEAIFNKTSPTGQNEVVFDATGEIFDLLFGEDSGVIGFAGPDYVSNSPPYEIVEGSVFLNGAFVDGRTDNGELPLNEFAAVTVHEIGHLINLAHSQVNGRAILDHEDVLGFGVPPVSSVETMFPLFFDGSSDAVTPHADDIAILSILYPATLSGNPYVIHNTGTISGIVHAQDGSTPLNGVNVVARNTSGGSISVFTDAISQISGAYVSFGNNGGSSDPQWAGKYFLSGLTPGADYAIAIDELASGPYSSEIALPLPGPAEYYNGVRESANPAVDARDDIEFVNPVINSIVSGIDIFLNRELTLRRYDGTVEAVETPGSGPGTESYFAVRYGVPASIDTPFTISGIRFFNGEGSTVWPRIMICEPDAAGQPNLLAPVHELVDVPGVAKGYLDVPLTATLTSRSDFFAVIQVPAGNAAIGADTDQRQGAIPGSLFSTGGEDFHEIATYNLAIEVLLYGLEREDPHEPNNTIASATPVQADTLVHGYLASGNDADVFEIQALTGDFVVIDLFARRFGSLLDGVLSVSDAAGVEIARSDDQVPGENPDPHLEIEFLHDGPYFLTIDRFEGLHTGAGTGGQAYFYDLAVTKLLKSPRLTHQTATVSFSVWSNGIYGDDGTGTGRGFSFGDHSGSTLFAGGFIAVSGTRIAANIPSLALPDRSHLIDFESQTALGPFSATRGFDEISTTVFADGSKNLLGEPLAIEVKQTSYSAHDDDFVLISCTVVNTGSESISNLYLGQFADWDIGATEASFSRNLGGYDAFRSLVYQYEDGDSKADSAWYGVKALQAASGSRILAGVVPQQLASYLADFDGPGPQPLASPQDYMSLIGSGPFHLQAGDSVRVGFAWLAGTGEVDLKTNADLAQQKWRDFVVHIENSEPEIPVRTSLQQNYPNPFNPGTVIEYTLSHAGPVSLIVYNIRGQVVRRLVHAQQPASSYRVEWDGTGTAGRPVANGLYFYQLKTTTQTLVHKMLLVR